MAAKTSSARIEQIPLSSALGERYLSYALSTIMARSLPDVRDGLKPVHRRLLFAMRQLKLDPASGFKKCARVVGDVMGKYHPHGDAAIYDALVRLAQNFAVRYPLVDGQGNFGNIDGDNPAAMRYTEARLTAVAQALLEGIDEDTVDFRDTYDGEGAEPVVLPANFPNLLANGATGIAVGMATNIPPHNAGELCAALLHLIKYPKATIAKLVDLVPGPDFPTGGELVEPRSAVIDAYTSGRGSFRIRSKWHVEKQRGGLFEIVVTEIPYQVQKGRLVEKIAELLNNKKLGLLGDVRDESAADLRLVLVPKSRNVDPHMLMETLFRHTDLESRFGLNMNVLDAEQTPRVMSLRDVLRAFLDHRLLVLKRRTKHRLGKIDHRLEVLDGYLIAYLNIDEVIRIIREAEDPKAAMVKKWKLSDLQAEAILNMRLRALRKLEEIQIQKEHKNLTAEKKSLRGLLRDPKRQWKRVSEEIGKTRTAFGEKTEIGKRRTTIGKAVTADIVPIEAMIEREPVTILCSEKGWIRASRGHLTDTEGVKYKEGDGARFAFHAETTDRLLMFGTNGRFYTLAVDRLPGGRGHGEPIRLMCDLGNDHDIVALFVHESDRKLLVASSDGRGFVVPEAEVVAQTRAGKQILNVSGGVEAQACSIVSGDHVATIGDNRKLLIFPLEEVPEMNRGRGVILQRYKKDGLSDVAVFTLADGLVCRTGGRMRTFIDLADWIGRRGQAGRLPPPGFPRNNRFL